MLLLWASSLCHQVVGVEEELHGLVEEDHEHRLLVIQGEIGH